MKGLRRLGASALSVFKELPAAAKSRASFLLFGTALAAIAVWLLHRGDPMFETFARDHQDPGLVRIAQQLSSWGELHLAPLLAVLIIAGIGVSRNLTALRWAALAGFLSGGAGGILVNAVKVLVGRPRPCTHLPDGIHWFTTGWDYASFPSGHAAHCFAIAVGVAVLAPRSGLVLICGSLAVCWSRWYLIRHYVTDVAAGAWLGLAVGLMIGIAARRVAERGAGQDGLKGPGNVNG